MKNALNNQVGMLGDMFLWLVHCKYIGRKYYDILSCLIYHRNLLVICTVDGGVQPMAAAVFDYSHS